MQPQAIPGSWLILVHHMQVQVQATLMQVHIQRGLVGTDEDVLAIVEMDLVLALVQADAPRTIDFEARELSYNN